MTHSALAILVNANRIAPYQKPWESSAPAYTIRKRTSFGELELGRTSKDARPEVTSKDVISALTNTLTRSPAFSLVSRTYIDETRECTKSPGPQRYTQPDVIANLRHPLYPMPPTKVFAGSERKIHIANKTPAPGEYEVKLDTFLTRAPAYGFRFKPNEGIQSALAPDSGSYDVGETTRMGKMWRGPSWTVRGRIDRTPHHDKEDDAIGALALEDAVNGRKKIDTSGCKHTKRVPNWSFAKSRRF